MPTELRYCEKCRKTMADTNFYTLKTGEKSDICKRCETLHIDNYDPETFIWLLEKYDVPYIPAEWDVLREKAFKKDPYKMNGMSVFGKYLSKMKLKQWKNYTYADTEKLQEEAEENARLLGKSKQAIEEKINSMKEAYENGEINEAQFKTYVDSQELELTPPPGAMVIQPGTVSTPSQPPQESFYPVNDNPFEQVEIPDPGADLTEEDKIYLAMKWGRLYSGADWVTMEKHYKEYEQSFDIHNADLERGLIQLSKMDLKMNQALDTGDFDTYSKLSRTYDTLRKSLKFTEAQNKEKDVKEFDSVGAIVAFCEKEGGFIPTYKIEAPKDIVDTIIQDNKDYLQTLIHNDANLSQQIEQFLKKREILEEQKYDRLKAREQGLTDYELTDADVAEYHELFNSVEDVSEV